MAVTGRRSFLTVALLPAFVSALPSFADQSLDLRHRLSDVATALAAGDASQAMEPFDKQSFKDYEKLDGFFEGLTGAYQVDSQIEITDETTDGDSAVLKLHWTLTLTDPATNLDQRRDADITVKLTKKKNAWSIVSFSPLEMFDPQAKR